jgi:hypothetical protein
VRHRTGVTLNTTTISPELLREIVRFVMPPGVHGIKIAVRNAANVHGGAAWVGGRRVGIRFDTRMRYPNRICPYWRGQLRGKSYWLASLEERIVYITAHELRHMWQKKARNKAGYVWGARGRYSEIDADSYAIRMLREWRRRPGLPACLSGRPA